MNVEAFHKRLTELYLPPHDAFTLVDMPAVNYMVVDGEGKPEREAFQSAVKWLFSLAHLIMPLVRERMGQNFRLWENQ